MTNLQAKIVKVYEIGTHAYDDTQRETAVRVLLSNGRRCWMVGYGGNYIPASKNDIENIYNRKLITKKDDGSNEWEEANRMIGSIEFAYRNR
jgi:hypothetical protein